jgi:hypothetical protein
VKLKRKRPASDADVLAFLGVDADADPQPKPRKGEMAWPLRQPGEPGLLDPPSKPRKGSSPDASAAPRSGKTGRDGHIVQRNTYILTVKSVDGPIAYRARLWATDRSDAHNKARALVRWLQSGLMKEVGLRFWLPKPPESTVVEHWMEIDPERILLGNLEGPFAPCEHPEPTVPRSGKDDEWWCFRCGSRSEICDCAQGPLFRHPLDTSNEEPKRVKNGRKR